MLLHARSAKQIGTLPLPGKSAVIRMADSREQLAIIKDEANVAARLDLIFNDATDEFIGVRPPGAEDARRILAFISANKHLLHLVAQCQVGVGRSVALIAALLKINGDDPKAILSRGTYNRRLYQELLTAAGVPQDPEPLISIAVRVKYAPDRLKLFILSMQRQRYQTWELVAVTDGPNPAAADVVTEMHDPRVRIIETDKRLGRWGHPYRQLGLDACHGDFIGMSNDDNYYVPGYLEQMLGALENADIAMCEMLHSYSGWSIVSAGEDLGSWIARTSLVRRVPWTGQDFDSDTQYLKSLKDLARGRVAIVKRPLFVHN